MPNGVAGIVQPDAIADGPCLTFGNIEDDVTVGGSAEYGGISRNVDGWGACGFVKPPIPKRAEA